MWQSVYSTQVYLTKERSTLPLHPACIEVGVLPPARFPTKPRSKMAMRSSRRSMQRSVCSCSLRCPLRSLTNRTVAAPAVWPAVMSSRLSPTYRGDIVRVLRPMSTKEAGEFAHHDQTVRSIFQSPLAGNVQYARGIWLREQIRRISSDDGQEDVSWEMILDEMADRCSSPASLVRQPGTLQSIAVYTYSKFRVQSARLTPRDWRYSINATRPGCGCCLSIAARSMASTFLMATSRSTLVGRSRMC